MLVYYNKSADKPKNTGGKELHAGYSICTGKSRRR